MLTITPQPTRSMPVMPLFGKTKAWTVPTPIAPEKFENPNHIPEDIYSLIRDSAMVSLHDHLRGSTDTSILRAEFLKLLGKQDKISIPVGDNNEGTIDIPVESSAWDNWDKLKETFRFRTKPGEEFSLNDYRIFYDKIAKVVGKDPAAIYLASYMYTIKAAMHNVRYFEVRNNMGTNDPGNIVKAMTRGMEDARRQVQKWGKRIDYGINVGIYRYGDETIVDGPNGQPMMSKVAKGMKEAQLAIELRKAGYPVVSIDLAGDEAQMPLTAFQPVYDLIHAHNDAMVEANTPEKRLGITLHSGETENSTGAGLHIKEGKPVQETYKGWETIVKAIEAGWRKNTPLRIGHGIELFNAPPEVLKNLIPEIREKGIHFEICPKCNNQTRQIYYSAHPLNHFLMNNLSISINSDNQTTSNTDTTAEFVKLLKTGVTHDTRKKIALNSIDAAFIFDPKVKAKIKKDIERLYTRLDYRPSKLLAQKREKEYVNHLLKMKYPDYKNVPKLTPLSRRDIEQAAYNAARNAIAYYGEKFQLHQSPAKEA